MFFDCSSDLPFAGIRFNAATSSVSGSDVLLYGQEVMPCPFVSPETNERMKPRPWRFQGDRFLGESLPTPSVPDGLIERLHAWVDSLVEEAPQ